jgi:hypothetical protein
VTGVRHRDLLAEKAARDAAATLDVAEVRKQAFSAGFEAGHAAGWQALTEALHGLYKSEGIGAVQEFLDELDADETEDAE